MQNDSTSSQAILKSASEDKKKDFVLFLQRRQLYRSGLPLHPASDSPVPAHTTTIANNAIDKSTSGEPRQPNFPLLHPDDDGVSKLIDKPAPEQTHEQFTESANAGKTELARTLEPPSHGAFGLVVVCSNFRYLPSLADKTKDIANQLFHALTDSHFGRFSRRGSKLLINPSLIEFQDTMKELKEVITEVGEGASFFMCLASHGARVTSGVNEGSYVLFCETRLSSEEELLLTALHEVALAKMIHDIPCTNKLVTLELCQVKQALEKPVDEAPTIVNRIHEAFTSRLYGQLVKLQLVSHQKRQPTLTEAELLSAKSALFNTVLLESCNLKSEAPVRCSSDNVSNFLHRLNDAFHGAAAKVVLDGGDQPTIRSSFSARDICAYVKAAVEQDARNQNELIKVEYNKQVRTKYELVAQFEDITHTPQVLGLDRLSDFSIGDIPAAPELSPSPPRCESATTSSITISWETGFGGFHPTTSVEVPGIFGFHVEIRGDGRACEKWRRASDYQLLSFDEAFRDKKPPATQTSVFGLPSDAAFRFRLRARTAGGWGPFSVESKPIRTLSRASVHDTYSSVEFVFRTRGVAGVHELMQSSPFNRNVLRTGIEFLSRVVKKDEPKAWHYSPSLPLPGDLVVPLVKLSVEATEKFTADGNLARGSCLLIGRLAQLFAESWRKDIMSIHEPQRVIDFLEQVADRFATTQLDTRTTAAWASSRLRGVSGRYRMKPEAAARCIQGLYRTRKARQHVRTLASAVYTQLVDASTGQLYFYNSKTGTTSWSLPAFLGS